jgi:DNA invertase Pin-like site-specific DNA recombinase
MNVAVYLRVSTSHQTVENQEKQLIKFAESRDWTIVQTFKDEGISGDKTDRPAFMEMISMAKSGHFDCLLVFQLSRLGRSLNHIVSTIAELNEAKVGVYCLSEHISTMDDNPYAKVTLAIFAALAEVELGLIRERVRAGVKRAQDNGVKFGRPHKGFDIGRAIQLRKDGLSLRKIAKQLDISPATLSNTFKKMDQGSVQ